MPVRGETTDGKKSVDRNDGNDLFMAPMGGETPEFVNSCRFPAIRGSVY